MKNNKILGSIAVLANAEALASESFGLVCRQDTTGWYICNTWTDGWYFPCWV